MGSGKENDILFAHPGFVCGHGESRDASSSERALLQSIHDHAIIKRTTIQAGKTS